MQLVGYLSEKYRIVHLFCFLSVNLTKAFDTVKTWTFTRTCKLGSPRKKNKPPVKFLQEPWGFSMPQEGEDCFSRMQPETESDTSQESIHSKLRWVAVTVSWDCSVTESLADGVSWSLYHRRASPVLCYEVLQALNHIDLLITAPQKQTCTEKNHEADYELRLRGMDS